MWLILYLPRFTIQNKPGWYGFWFRKKTHKKVWTSSTSSSTKNGYTIAILSSLERKTFKTAIACWITLIKQIKIARNQTITIHSTCKWTIYYLQTTNHIYSDPVAYPPANWDVMMSPRKGLFQKECHLQTRIFQGRRLFSGGLSIGKPNKKQTIYIAY